jgi:chemotaxis protein methyltransferase CheR
MGVSDAMRHHAQLKSDAGGFELLARRLKQIVGVDLPVSPKNLALMAGRLGPLLRRHGLWRYRQLDELVGRNQEPLVREFISLMTTHTTHFFRESNHFGELANAVRRGEAERKGSENRPLRVWCAAASTGQEPYSILMTLLDAKPSLKANGLKFLATDIDRASLIKASRGVYSAAEIDNVPRAFQRKFFDSNPELDLVQIKPQLRKQVTFAEFNLLQTPYPFQFPFDVIFCRNVLIYFEAAETKRVCEKLVSALAQGGYLFLAHAETALVRKMKLQQVAPATFRKV